MFCNPEGVINILGMLLIVEYKDLILLSFQVSSAAVFTVTQEVPAMTNYLNLVVVSLEHLCYISERTSKRTVLFVLQNLEFAGK